MPLSITSPTPNQKCTFDEKVNVSWQWLGSPAVSCRVEVAWDGKNYVSAVESLVSGTSCEWQVRGAASNMAMFRVTGINGESATVPITIQPAGVPGPPGPPGPPSELGLVSKNVFLVAPPGQSGPGETLSVSNDPYNPAINVVSMTSIMPSGTRLLGGWYTPVPLTSHGAVTSLRLATLEIGRHSDAELRVKASTQPGHQGHVQIVLFGLWAK